ncbi:MAG: flotillin domain-containing protein [Hyphomicrobiaceae bacterium]
MSMSSTDILVIVILLTILVAIAVYLLHWLYRHSTKDQSFVRTGLGGEKVVMGGGALIIPIVHTITRVNMNAIPIEIRRTNEQSLITKNKMRIDIVAEFFVRVLSTREGVSIAARTLGERTQSATELKEMVEGRFIDAMATVAATMTMEEIHTNRGRYISEVAELAKQTLGANGLELENASLTSLNQSDISVFNPTNAFDAEGLAQLTEQIEERRKLRNRIENDARIEITLKDYETEQRSLEIARDLEYARIAQQRDIEMRKAEQLAQIEDERAASQISVELARIKAEQEAERNRIAKERLVESERITTEAEIRNLAIERRQSNELTEINTQKTLEAQRILTRQQIETDRIENERKIREHDIRTRQTLALIETSALGEVDRARLDRDKSVESARIETLKAIELLGVEKDKQIRVTNEIAASDHDRARIMGRYYVEMERLSKDEEIAQAEIAKREKVKLAETTSLRNIEDASIAAGREIDELRIAARKYIDRFEIEMQKEIEIVDKERLIAVINKSIEEAYARTSEAEALKAQAAMEEQILTARDEEAASRAKRVDLINTASRVERESMRITSFARAEKEASEFRALARIAEANADEVRYAKDAAGQLLLNESENMRSEASRRSAIYENLVRNLPNIIRETVKPMENIDSIKILQVDGLPGINSPSETGGGRGGSGGSEGGSMTDRVVNSAMKYRTQVALVDGLMKELGLPVDSIGSAGGMSFRNFMVSDQQKDKDD